MGEEQELTKYRVTLSVVYTVDVEAENEDDAKDVATSEYCWSGELEDIIVDEVEEV